MKNYITTYDPFFNTFFKDEGASYRSMMKTDIKENDKDYEMKIELPEVKKENIKVELRNGYLKVSASLNKEHNEEGKYLFREREYGEFSRSYYVGEDVELKNVHAKLADGVLTLHIDKVSKKEENRYIAIE